MIEILANCVPIATFLELFAFVQSVNALRLTNTTVTTISGTVRLVLSFDARLADT